MPMVLDDLTLAAVGLVAAGGYVGLGLLVSEIYKWIPEWRILSQARKKNLPVLALTVPGTGETDLILGEKDEKGDPIFSVKGQSFGIQVDPKFSGQIVPDRLAKGLRVYHYGTTTPLALDGRHCMALQTVIHTIRTEFPQLQFLTDDQVLALLDTPRDDLEEYCESLYEMTATTAVQFDIHDARALMKLIIDAQDRTAEVEVPSSGMYSYAYAFKNIPTAYLSQDLHQYGLLIERKVRKLMEDFTKKFGLILTVAFAALMVIIGGAVAHSIVT